MSDENQAPMSTVDSATAHLETLMGPDNAGAPEQGAAQPDAPAQEAQAPQSQSEQAQVQQVIDEFEIDYNGQRHKLTNAERDYLVRFGLDAFRQAHARGGQKPQEQAQQNFQAQQPAQQDDHLGQALGRIEKLEKQLQEAETQREVERIQSKLEAAVAKVEVYGKLKDPEHQAMFKQLVMMEQYSNPSMSPETAAENANRRFSSLLRDQASAYVQAKVDQATKKIEKGGASAGTPQAPLGSKDLNNGNVLKSAMNRLRQFAKN